MRPDGRGKEETLSMTDEESEFAVSNCIPQISSPRSRVRLLKFFIENGCIKSYKDITIDACTLWNCLMKLLQVVRRALM
jgi:hypothetical protein